MITSGLTFFSTIAICSAPVVSEIDDPCFSLDSAPPIATFDVDGFCTACKGLEFEPFGKLRGSQDVILMPFEPALSFAWVGFEGHSDVL
jgi:hypothetical protein